MLERTALKALTLFSPEEAHRLAIMALKRGLGPRPSAVDDPALAVTLWGRRFVHPIGVAAGFDKNAEAPDAVLAAGASFMEIGAVTPRPQVGNPKPRLFRLAEDAAAINRFGFNNDGLAQVSARLAARKGPIDFIGANLGANKDSADRMADYETLIRGLWGLVGFFTINVSSPNTEKLRDLQGEAALRELLTRVVAQRDRLVGDAPADDGPVNDGPKAPVLLKVAPDLSDDEIDAVASVALAVGIDGIIATNTTLARPETLRSRHAAEKGGLSGAPVFERSTAVLRRLRRTTGRQVPLIGVGGVSSAEQAYAKIKAGADLVQLYTALAYRGPGLLMTIARGLPPLLRADGFENVLEAVGVET